VGKGITFDTGGLNLKPTGGIEDMHMDMGGAAAVLGAMEGAAQAGLKLNVICAVALAENAIGKDAVKPNALIHSLDGKSVEVGNTDAEGRLVLCDTVRSISAV
jgi:leucyl aminopeptidase